MQFGRSKPVTVYSVHTGFFMEKPQDIPTVSAFEDTQTGSPRNTGTETETVNSVLSNQDSGAVAMDVDAMESELDTGNTTPEVSLSEDELETVHRAEDDLFAPRRIITAQEKKALAEAKRTAYNAGRVLLCGQNERAVPVRRQVPVKPAAAVSETFPAQTPEEVYREMYQKLIQKQKMKKPKDTVAESRALCNEVTELVQQLKPILEKGVQKAQSSLERLQKTPKPVASKSKR